MEKRSNLFLDFGFRMGRVVDEHIDNEAKDHFGHPVLVLNIQVAGDYFRDAAGVDRVVLKREHPAGGYRNYALIRRVLHNFFG